MKNRRECQIYSKSDLLSAFESANTKIMTKFKDSTAKICNQGIDYLREITFNYLKEQQNQPITYPTFQPSNLQSTYQNQELVTRKTIFNNNHYVEKPAHRQMTFNQKQESEINQKTCQFFRQSQMKQKLQSTQKKKERDSSTEKLKKSFKKMGLDDRFYLENEEGSDPEEQQNTNLLNYQNNQNKSLAQLIHQSNRKLQEKIAQKRFQQIEESSDQSYPITDYSSNNSSNQNDYTQEFKKQTEGIITSSSQSLQSSQTYNPMKILHSPKKSKSQSKRLYIRNKKIPKWAQNINKVNQTVQYQKNDPNINPNLIYGCCVVEKLDTNIIFKSQEKFFRGSSAKWGRNPFNQFIT